MAIIRNNTGALNVNNGSESAKYPKGVTFAEVITLCKLGTNTNTAPDFRGKVKVDGQEYYVSGWYKPQHDFVSLSFTSPDQTGNK